MEGDKELRGLEYEDWRRMESDLRDSGDVVRLPETETGEVYCSTSTNNDIL